MRARSVGGSAGTRSSLAGVPPGALSAGFVSASRELSSVAWPVPRLRLVLVCRYTGIPADSAKCTVLEAPGDLSRTNARQTSAAPWCSCQSAGWRSTLPPQRRQNISAIRFAPCGAALVTRTVSPSPQTCCSASRITAGFAQVRDPVTSTRRGGAPVGVRSTVDTVNLLTGFVLWSRGITGSPVRRPICGGCSVRR